MWEKCEIEPVEWQLTNRRKDETFQDLLTIFKEKEMKKRNVVMMILLTLAIAMPATLSFAAPKQNTNQAVAQLEKINVNTASADSLTTVPGIGPKTAERILTYRQQHGKFSAINDLLEVKGIGEKSLKKIGRYLTI